MPPGEGRTGLSEAEKALKKYPNMFDIVHQSALLYRSFGVEGKDPALLRRALELLESAKPLLPQNTDPKVSGSTLSAESAEVLLSLGSAGAGRSAAAEKQCGQVCTTTSSA